MRTRPSSFHSCQAEIANFDRQVVVKENVVTLQVAVNNIFGM